MKRECGEQFSGMMRMVNTDLPRRPIRSWANHSEIPTKVDHPTVDPMTNERMDGAIGLGD